MVLGLLGDFLGAGCFCRSLARSQLSVQHATKNNRIRDNFIGYVMLQVCQISCLIVAISVVPIPRRQHFEAEQSIVGVWTLVRLETRDQLKKDLLATTHNDFIIAISTKKIVFNPRTEQMTVVGYRVFPEQNPKHIDLVSQDGQISKGIYEIHDGGLILCFSSVAKCDRPSKFATLENDRDQTILIFRRTKQSTD